MAAVCLLARVRGVVCGAVDITLNTYLSGKIRLCVLSPCTCKWDIPTNRNGGMLETSGDVICSIQGKEAYLLRET